MALSSDSFADWNDSPGSSSVEVLFPTAGNAPSDIEDGEAIVRKDESDRLSAMTGSDVGLLILSEMVEYDSVVCMLGRIL